MFNLVSIAQASNKIGQNTNLITGTGKIEWVKYVNWVVSLLTTISLIAIFIYFIWGAIRIITASGDKAKFTAGRQRITWAAMGGLILAGAYAIWRLTLLVANIESLQFGGL